MCCSFVAVDRRGRASAEGPSDKEVRCRGESILRQCQVRPIHLPVVRGFARGAMGRRIGPSWWTHQASSRSSQCSTTGVTKAVVCAFLVDPSNYFSFQPVLHNWCYKGRGMCHPLC